MLWPAESIYEGTWSSGPPPDELRDFELMHAMGWTWQELEATPAYVRRYCWDLLMAKREAEKHAVDREQRRQPKAG